MSTNLSKSSDVQVTSMSPLVDRILEHARARNCTDIHIVFGDNDVDRTGRILARIAGELKPVQKWTGVADDQGKLINGVQFEDIQKAFFPPDAQGNSTYGRTTVHRFDNVQIRAIMLQVRKGTRILLRIQSVCPPLMTQLLRHNPATIRQIGNARGLILVAGPIGGGKTTFAASVAQAWAAQGRHVMTVEDPVEYEFSTFLGLVTQLEASDGVQDAHASNLDAVMPSILRADIDALYLGELRTAKAVSHAISIAGAREPVIATFHAGSIVDAITRLINLAAQEIEVTVAMRTIAQCLEAVVFIDLAFDQNGSPIPVINYCPLSEASRKTLTEGNRNAFLAALNSGLSGAPSTGAINPKAAVEAARSQGATQPSLDRAELRTD